MQFFWHKFLKTLFDQGKEIGQYISEQVKTFSQEKILASNFIGTGELTTLRFSNLVIGQWYKVQGHISMTANTDLRIVSGLNFVGRVFTVGSSDVDSFSYEFQASATELTFVNNANTTIVGDNTKLNTYVELSSINNRETTTQWT